MQKNEKGKQILVALLLTLAVEGAVLLCLGWGGAQGWIDAGHLLVPSIAASAVAAALGALYLGLRRWSAVPAALITGVGTQMILLLAGYFVFGHAGFAEKRWWMPVIAFAAAVIAVLFLAKPKAGMKKKRPKKHRK